MLCVIVVLIYNYTSGSSKNKSIVRDFLGSTWSVFRNNFYHVGLQLKVIDDLDGMEAVC